MIDRIKPIISRIKLPNYGRNIPIVAKELYSSTIREKKFYLAALYFMAIPVLMNLIAGFGNVVFRGTGIALFYAQTTTLLYFKIFYISLIGQILLVVLTADQIAGEIEMKTFPLIRSKPIYDSEIVFGKFSGMMMVMVLLDLPAVFITYFYYLIALDAESNAYLSTMDEVVGAIVFLLLLQGVIIALTLLFSSMFNKSLYAILGSLLILFTMSTISGNVLTADPTAKVYYSFEWILDAFLPYIFYHIEPLEDVIIPSLLSFLLTIVSIIVGLLVSATLILRNKEVQ